jgi:enoyl-[acyl-carrier protein] reductase III
MNIVGVHLDRREKLPHVEDVQKRIRDLGREAVFFNFNAADDERRYDAVEEIRQKLTADPANPGTVRVLLHSLAFGTLRALAGSPEVVNKKQMELTADVMGHSLVFWVQDLLRAGLLESYARIFAMTSGGSQSAIPHYGAVGAAKAAL